jgi:maleate isomerase
MLRGATVRAIHSKPVDSPLTAGRAHRAKLGFVLLAMEETVEADVFDIVPEGVGVHFSRVAMSNDVTFDELAAMGPDIATSAGLILPEGTPDVLCYTCNLGTIVIGEDNVAEVLREGRAKDLKATTVITGVARALSAVGARKITVLTPYSDEVNPYVYEYLAGKGFELLDFQGLNLTQNSDIGRVDPEFILSYARALDRPDADALLICCGALRSTEIVGRLEEALGKPVITSNQAMMWDCLRLAGIDDEIKGYGRLFEIDSASHRNVLEAARTVELTTIH